MHQSSPELQIVYMLCKIFHFYSKNCLRVSGIGSSCTFLRPLVPRVPLSDQQLNWSKLDGLAVCQGKIY